MRGTLIAAFACLLSSAALVADESIEGNYLCELEGEEFLALQLFDEPIGGVNAWVEDKDDIAIDGNWFEENLTVFVSWNWHAERGYYKNTLTMMPGGPAEYYEVRPEVDDPQPAHMLLCTRENPEEVPVSISTIDD